MGVFAQTGLGTVMGWDVVFDLVDWVCMVNFQCGAEKK
jgi:hypothetical protein